MPVWWATVQVPYEDLVGLDLAANFGAWKRSSPGFRYSPFSFPQSGGYMPRSPGYLNSTFPCRCRVSGHRWQVASFFPYYSTQQINLLQDKMPKHSYWDEYMNTCSLMIRIWQEARQHSWAPSGFEVWMLRQFGFFHLQPFSVERHARLLPVIVWQL